MKFRPQVESLGERINPTATPVTPVLTTPDVGGNTAQVTLYLTPNEIALQIAMAKLHDAELARDAAKEILDREEIISDSAMVAQLYLEEDLETVYNGLIALGYTDEEAKADPDYKAVEFHKLLADIYGRQNIEALDTAIINHSEALNEIERLEEEIERLILNNAGIA